MELEECPHCGMQVVRNVDGACPVCRQTLGVAPSIQQAAAEPAPAASPNPYASPLAESPHAAAALALHKPGAVALATFLGSFLGGTFVMAVNYARMDRRVHASVAVLAGLGATIAWLAWRLWWPEVVPLPNSVLIGVQIFLMYFVADQLQSPDLKDHLAQGARRASYWGAAGWGLLAGLLLFAVIVALVLLVPGAFP